MAMLMVGLGVALAIMSVGIGWAVSKDMKDLIDFGYDPTNEPRRV
jgi:hypothetical protein